MCNEGGTKKRPGNPFKMTTVALLIVAIVMAGVTVTSSPGSDSLSDVSTAVT